MDPNEKFACPSCGWELPYGSPTCGNCGSDLRPYYGGPLGGGPTGSPIPSGLIRFLILVGVVIAAGYFLADPIRNALEGLEESFGEDGSVEEVGEPVPEPGVIGGFRRIPALARALNQGGLRCRPVVVDQADSFTTTGSCQANGTHVQINIYRRPEVLEPATEIFEESDFSWVHDDGWFVITQPPVARRVHEILGGRLRVVR